MKLKTFLVNTSSHEIINKSMGIHDDARMREDPNFKANMRNFIRERYRMLLRSVPPGPMGIRFTG